MRHLIIFDINGTIIKRDDRTDVPYSRSLDEIIGTDNAMQGIDTSARSDKDVFMEALGRHGINYSNQLWKTFLMIYEKYLNIFKDSDCWRENANSIQFIKKLHNKGHALALMTGELKIGARYKLQKLGVWDYFPAGGFGEDGLKRFEIADIALERAKEHFNEDFDSITIIGDTVLDIKTARHLNSRVISITTGANSFEELAHYGPDLIIDDFDTRDLAILFNIN